MVVMMLSSGLGPLLVEGEGVEEGPLTSGVLGLTAQLAGSFATSKRQQNQKLPNKYILTFRFASQKLNHKYLCFEEKKTKKECYNVANCSRTKI